MSVPSKINIVFTWEANTLCVQENKTSNYHHLKIRAKFFPELLGLVRVVPKHTFLPEAEGATPPLDRTPVYHMLLPPTSRMLL